MELFWDFLIGNYTPKQLSVDRLDETILKHYTDYCMTEEEILRRRSIIIIMLSEFCTSFDG